MNEKAQRREAHTDLPETTDPIFKGAEARLARDSYPTPWGKRGTPVVAGIATSDNSTWTPLAPG